METKTAITVTETKKMTMTLTQSNAMSQIMKTTMSITEGQRQGLMIKKITLIETIALSMTIMRIKKIFFSSCHKRGTKKKF